MTEHPGTDRPSHPGRPNFANLDFDQSPLIVIWETTQACGLACKHCRADARPYRSPGELDTAQAKQLLDDSAKMGTPVFVLSGGDPMRRDDLLELISYGNSLGLRMCTIPACTNELTRDQLAELRDAGIAKVAFSLDFPNAEGHDGIRGIPGTFAKTMEAAGWARELGISMQFNSLVCAETAPYLKETGDLIEQLGGDMWELMFLIPVGRGTQITSMTPELVEQTFADIYEIEQRGKFVVKVTEAPHYRRYMLQQGYDGGIHRVNSGKGFVFVSHTGDVMPSGFLPIACGNVKESSIADVYRNSSIMQSLRDPSNLTGKCGQCGYRDMCGGSRSRSYGLTGDIFASEPWCVYQPGGEEAMVTTARPMATSAHRATGVREWPATGAQGE